jgi:hypothetical protein
MDNVVCFHPSTYPCHTHMPTYLLFAYLSHIYLPIYYLLSTNVCPIYLPTYLPTYIYLFDALLTPWGIQMWVQTKNNKD